MTKKMEFAKAIKFDKFPGQVHPQNYVVTGISPSPEELELVEVNDLQDESMERDWVPGMRTPGKLDLTITGGMFNISIGTVGKIKVTMTPITTSASGVVTKGQQVTIVDDTWAIVTSAAPTKLEAGKPIEFGVSLQLLKDNPIMEPSGGEVSSGTGRNTVLYSATPNGTSGPAATGGEEGSGEEGSGEEGGEG